MKYGYYKNEENLRSEKKGVFIMAANIKAFPRMDMSISGALRTQFMMTIVPGVELSSLSE